MNVPSIEHLVERAIVEASLSGRNNGGYWLAQQLWDNGYEAADLLAAGELYVAACPPTNMKGKPEAYRLEHYRKTIRQVTARERREPWRKEKITADFGLEIPVIGDVDQADQISDPAGDPGSDQADLALLKEAWGDGETEIARLLQGRWQDARDGDGEPYPDRETAAQVLQRALRDLTDDKGQVERIFQHSGLARTKEEGKEPAETFIADGDWAPPAELRRGTVPSFPKGIFPRWLEEQVLAVAESYQVPVDLPALLALGALAGAVHAKVRCHVRGDWYEQAALWVLPVLETGAGKTPTFGEMLGPLREREEELRAHYELLEDEREARKKSRKALRRACEQSLENAKSPEERLQALNDLTALEREEREAAKELRPRLLAADATVEKIGRLLSETGGRLVIQSDEGAPIKIVLGRYRDDGPAVETLMAGYSGGEFRVDRVRDNLEICVPEAQLTYILSPQPEVLRALTASKELHDIGFTARWLFAVPTSIVGQRNVDSAPVPPAVREQYRERMRSLLLIPARRGDNGCLERTTIRFDQETQERIQGFRRGMESRLGQDGDGRELKEWLMKLHGQVARIALLLHLADTAGTPDWHERPVPRTAVDRALALVPYLEAHAWLAHYDAVTDADDLTVDDAERVLQWIRRNGLARFTRNQVWNALKNKRLRTPDTLEPALLLLQRHGHLQIEEVATGQKGGRPTTWHRVNPAVLR